MSDIQTKSMLAVSRRLIHNLNLTDHESRVYLATLELGQTTIQEISRKSGVKRTSIYNFLESMKARGLIIQTRKKNREYFSALHPRQFLEMEKVKIKQFERLLPELVVLATRRRGQPRVQFFEGIEGIRSVYALALSANKELIGWSDFDSRTKLLGEEFFTDYFIPARIRRGILSRRIVVDTPLARRMIAQNNKHLRETKMMPIKGELLTEVDVFNDTVTFMSFRSQPPVAVVITDQALAETLKLVWSIIWNSL